MIQLLPPVQFSPPCTKLVASPPRKPPQRIRYLRRTIINSKQEDPVFRWKLPVIPLGIFALGFIDAGYSGDWSRIGVISTETEDLLKAAAFVVVPLCIFAIISLSLKGGED